jgi:hypothetical protein
VASAFGGQRSIQLSYGCLAARDGRLAKAIGRGQTLSRAGSRLGPSRGIGRAGCGTGGDGFGRLKIRPSRRTIAATDQGPAARQRRAKGGRLAGAGKTHRMASSAAHAGFEYALRAVGRGLGGAVRLLLLGAALAGSAASAAPAAPPVNCQTLAAASPLVLPATAARLSQIIVEAPLLAENASASVLARKPAAGQAATSFRVRARATARVPEEWLAVEDVRDRVEKETAEDLKIAEPNDWYQLVLLGPESSGIAAQLRRSRTLDIFACAADGSIVAAGTKQVTTTVAGTAKLLSFLIVLALYCGFVTVVWMTRRRLSQPKTVQAPLRWNRIQPFSWLRCSDPVVLTSDLFDRGSLSKLQVLIFTVLVVYLLSEILLRTGILTDVSPTVVYLLGIPAAGAIGTQLTGLTKDRLSSANWAWLVSRGILPVNDVGSGTPKWSDLFMSDGELDLYKLQAAAFSTVVVISMLQTGMAGFREFSVPESLLQILGLSQLVFIGGRFTKPATMGDLDTMITELKAREQTLRQAAATGIDVDAEGKPIDPPPKPAAGAPFAKFAAAGARGAVPNAAARYVELAQEVSMLLESMTHREVDSDPLLNPALS